VHKNVGNLLTKRTLLIHS